MFRDWIALLIGIAWIGITWYLTFTGVANLGPYSWFAAPLVTGAIVGRRGAGAIVGAVPNILLGVVVGAIVLRDVSQATPGSVEYVIVLYGGLLGAAILGVVGGIIGLLCGAIGGFVGGHLFWRKRPTASLTPMTAPIALSTNPVSSAASSRCVSCGQDLPGGGSSFCPNCGSQQTNVRVQSATPSLQVPSSSAPGSNSPFEGNQYVIDQRILTVRDTFGIKDVKGNLLTYVKKQLVSWGPKFWFEDTGGQRLGEIHGKILAVRPTFEIYDKQGNLLALVKKKILKLLGSEWWMETTDGQRIARIKGNIVDHDYRIETPSGTRIAQVHKKWVAFRDSYGVDILDRAISPFLTLSYVIAMDNTQHKGRSKLRFGRSLFR